MKRGYYVLIGGATLFVIGIAVTAIGAIPLAQKLQEESVILQGSPISAGESRNVSLAVKDTSRQLSIIIGSSDPDVPLNAVLTTPEGGRAIDSDFKENNVLGARPAAEGTYILTVTNEGTEDTNVDVVFGYLPGAGENNQVDVEAFGGVIAGAGLAVAGVLVMIAGVVVIVIDSRKKKAPAAT